MAIVRAQVTLKHVSALAEDDLVNVLHFSTADVAAGTLESIKTACINIYNRTNGANSPLYTFFSTEMAQNGHSVKLYNMDEPKPRAPISETTWNLPAAPNGDPLPGEVAVCMSFQAEPTSGLIQARRRGRLYFGRLDKDSSSAGRPSSALISTLAGIGSGLLGDASADPDWSWIVLSAAHTQSEKDPRPSYPQTFAVVTEGWVDNAFDTQRRRGLKATAKTLFV